MQKKVRQPCSFWHFAMKLFFAAHLSGLPSESTAFAEMQRSDDRSRAISGNRVQPERP
jgi:hypothetical protein